MQWCLYCILWFSHNIVIIYNITGCHSPFLMSYQLFIIFVIPAPLLGSNTVCDKNICYTFMENNVTWSEASNTCTARGQVLIDISSGIPEILSKVTGFGKVHFRPISRSMLCPPVSFWTHTKKAGKISYHRVII
jgi:hypothetical protein